MIIILITIILGISIIIYFNNKQANLYRQQKEGQKNFPLNVGSKGSEVEILQIYLNSKGEALVIDGIYGARTQEAVKRVLNVSEVSLDLYNKTILVK